MSAYECSKYEVAERGSASSSTPVDSYDVANLVPLINSIFNTTFIATLCIDWSLNHLQSTHKCNLSMFTGDTDWWWLCKTKNLIRIQFHAFFAVFSFSPGTHLFIIISLSSDFCLSSGTGGRICRYMHALQTCRLRKCCLQETWEHYEWTLGIFYITYASDWCGESGHWEESTFFLYLTLPNMTSQ